MHFLQNIISIVVYPFGEKAQWSFRIFWFIKPALVDIKNFDELQRKSDITIETGYYDQLADQFETGDLILFIGKNYNRDYVSAKWSYASPICHVGLIVKYNDGAPQIFEATSLNGVILRPLKQRVETYDSDMIMYRKLRVKRTDEMLRALDIFIDEVDGTLHDLHTLKGLIEMIRGAVDLFIPLTKIEIFRNKTTNLERIFCSELIAESYIRMGLLPGPNHPSYLPSNEYTPADFSNYSSLKNTEHELIDHLLLGAKLDTEIFILKTLDNKLVPAILPSD
jgi:hypothetical protein